MVMPTCIGEEYYFHALLRHGVVAMVMPTCIGEEYCFHALLRRGVVAMVIPEAPVVTPKEVCEHAPLHCAQVGRSAGEGQRGKVGRVCVPPGQVAPHPHEVGGQGRVILPGYDQEERAPE